MFKSFSGVASVRTGSLIAVCASLLLAGCSYDDPLLEDSYKPISVNERHPIRVEKAPVKVGIRTPAGSLSDEQKNAVYNFATEARRHAASRISIKWPSGSRASREAAQVIGQTLVDHGIPHSMIVLSSYPGSSTQPIQMSFERKVAITEECGDWSENLSITRSNRAYPNFGCAHQQNIAAMVANPEDFERPRAQSPVLAGNRTMVMKVFVDNGTAGDYFTLTGSGSGGG